MLNRQRYLDIIRSYKISKRIKYYDEKFKDFSKEDFKQIILGAANAK